MTISPLPLTPPSGSLAASVPAVTAAPLPERLQLAKEFESTINLIDQGRTVLADSPTPQRLEDRYFDSIVHGAATRLRTHAVKLAAVEPSSAELGIRLLGRAERFDELLRIGFGDTEDPASPIRATMRSTMNDAFTAASSDVRKGIEMLTTAPA